MAAVASLRKRGAATVILAVPVAAPESIAALREQAQEVICVEAPGNLWSVGAWYEDFTPTSDREVAALLAANASPRPRPAQTDRIACRIPADSVQLAGELTRLPGMRGIVLFAHGSGSSRFSPRNRQIADSLTQAGYATLLFDLLTPAEENSRTNVFDIPLLASRLVSATRWLDETDNEAELPLAYFGASTGAAAALTAAAELNDRISAVVSRGGRPDLALNLAAVRAPTLLIVGGADDQVLELNRRAQRQLRCPSELSVIPGATHLFQEPGALERVGELTTQWLDCHLQS
jgi:putative phosphoribosyl transferase